MWRNITGKPYITVSSKGLANGQSEYFNDGADFGPDSVQADGSLTQTAGIQEAVNYAYSSNQTTVYLKNGTYQINITSDSWKSDPNSTVDSYIIGIPSYMLQGIRLIGQGYGGWGDIYKGSRIVPSSEFSTKIFFNFIDTTMPNTYNNGLYVMSPASGENISGSSATDVYVDGIEFSSSLNSTSSTLTIVNFYYSSSAHGGTIKISTTSSTLTGMHSTVGLNTSQPLSQGGQTWERVYIAGFYQGIVVGDSHVSILQLYIDTCIIAITTLSYAHNSIILYANIQNVQYIIDNSSGASQLMILNIDTEISTSYPISFSSMFSTPANTFNGYFIFWQPTAISFPALGAIPDGTVINYIGVNTPTTPSVPTSGTAQENTNPYAVDVYVYGGDVTEIQITRNGTAYTVLSVSTAIVMSGQPYKLNPGDSITITYTTAPDWEWLSD